MQTPFQQIDLFITRLFICSDLLSKQLDNQLKKIGLNRTQLAILYHMRRQSDAAVSVSSLSKIMAINQPGITKAVQNLSKQKFVNKIRSEEDSRKQELRITTEGVEIIDSAQQVLGPLIAEVFENIPLSQLQQSCDLLQLMMTSLDSSQKSND